MAGGIELQAFVAGLLLLVLVNPASGGILEGDVNQYPNANAPQILLANGELIKSPASTAAQELSAIRYPVALPNAASAGINVGWDGAAVTKLGALASIVGAPPAVVTSPRVDVPGCGPTFSDSTCNQYVYGCDSTNPTFVMTSEYHP